MFVCCVIVPLINLVVYGTLLARINPNALLVAAGYSFWVDLIFTGVIAGLAAATGSLTALIISSVTGLFISVSLFAVKWWVGSATIKRVVVNQDEYDAYLDAVNKGFVDVPKVKLKRKAIVVCEAAKAPKWMPEAVNSFMFKVVKSPKDLSAKFFGLSVVDAEENSAVQAA